MTRGHQSPLAATGIAVTADDVRDAAACLGGIAHHTPVLHSRTLDDLARRTVFLKCENFQRMGAFKFRGAYNAASRLPSDLLSSGIVTYSSGNHAQSVALAARELGTHAVVVMPTDAPSSKADAVTGYGAQIVTYDRYTDDRVALGEQIAEQRGMALIPPYEHPHVIAGQGTAALELLEEIGDLDTLVIPVGGGGLIAGCATVATAMRPDLCVVGVEPVAGDDTKRSLTSGSRIRIPVPRTIADALTTDIPGELTYSINRRLVRGIALVSDAEILLGMRFAFDRLKLVLEPAGATGLAAVLARSIDEVAPGALRVGVILSGGNIDSRRFAELISA